MDEPRFDLEQIRAIIALAEDAGLAELTVEAGGVKISVKRAVPAGGLGPAATRPQALERPSARRPVRPSGDDIIDAALEEGLRGAPTSSRETNHFQPITAPMVGTFYRAANSEAPPFVEEGDQVEPGQTVCIIEAMKLFNEIQSEVRGRVVRVLAENGAPVEYGQPLFLVDPRRDGA